MTTRPFEGIRIIDITHVLAGPFAAYQLAVLGADVIKVEHPDDPDQSRSSGTDRTLNRGQMGTSFLTQGSNKRAITLDLKEERGREILKKLVAGADVLVENFRPGAFEALGLGYEALSALNPRLIYVSAFLPQPGQSLLEITQLPEAAGDAVQANIVVDGDPPVATMAPERAHEAVYHCATAEQVEWAMQRRASQPVIPFTQPFELGESVAAFAALPRAYISCLQDRAIRPPIQRRMYTAAGCDPVIEIDTDHSPWLSRTDELIPLAHSLPLTHVEPTVTVDPVEGTVTLVAEARDALAEAAKFQL